MNADEVSPINKNSQSLEIIELAESVFKNSRELEKWERDALDAFMWQELENN